MRLFCFFYLFCTTLFYYSFGQTDRGTLLLPKHPIEIDSFQQNNFVDLVHLRKITNFLTNVDVTTINGHIIPRRKKAFIRHIKHLSEILELSFFYKTKVDSMSYELFYELALYKASMIQAAKENSNRVMTFAQKKQIVKDTKRSQKVFRYSIIDRAKEVSIDPANSPFWHSTAAIEKKTSPFDQLAKEKKIKARKKMVIVFSELSLEGSAPKIKALDLDLDNEWSLKWGDEVHTDVLGSRIFAALGYDVDHPYFYKEDKLTLVFDGTRTVKNAEQLIDSVLTIYKIDIRPFVSSSGKITTDMIQETKELESFLGFEYVRFKKCAIEGRPDRVKRIGSFTPNQLMNCERRELRAALLVHAFIGNWDTREENTLLTTIHDGNYKYRISAAFSDLGTSFGVSVNYLPGDFKVGLVNEFPWEVAIVKKNELQLNNPINSILKPYEMATYEDLYWMATKIANLTEEMFWKMIDEAGWPKPIATLYFHKLASRRASILDAFQIEDQHPIKFDKELTISENEKIVVERGKLVVDYERENNPESFLSKKGRTRNYGN